MTELEEKYQEIIALDDTLKQYSADLDEKLPYGKLKSDHYLWVINEIFKKVFFVPKESWLRYFQPLKDIRASLEKHKDYTLLSDFKIYETTIKTQLLKFKNEYLLDEIADLGQKILASRKTS